MEEKIPQFLKDMLEKQYGKELTGNILDGYLKQRYVTLRINTLKTTIQEIKKELQEAKIKYREVKWYANALVIEEERENEIRKMKIYEEGKIYLQSLSSMLPPIILEPEANENILDMAAAPGGKTTQMAMITNNNAFITACEKNKIRAERLKYNIQKQGVSCVNVMTEDARKLSDYFSFDKILLDAPCSGSGTENIFSSKFSYELIERSTKTQEILLKKALNILKKDGMVVYSTCSVLQQENENIIRKVLASGKAEIVPIELKTDEIQMLPVNIPGTICVSPTDLYEGFFVAKIRRK